MEISHIEHLGIAVNSIEEHRPYYEQVLGLTCYSIEEVPDQKVKTAFFKVGQTKIELLEPTSPDSTIAKFIEKRGEGIHHIAFAVPDVQQSLEGHTAHRQSPTSRCRRTSDCFPAPQIDTRRTHRAVHEIIMLQILTTNIKNNE